MLQKQSLNKLIKANGIDLFLLLAFCVFALVIAFLFPDNQPRIYAENGLIENLQAILIALSGIIFFMTAISENKQQRLFFVFCTLLCYSALLRELDIEDFNIPHFFILLGSGSGRNITIALAFISLFAYAAFNKLHFYGKTSFKFIRSRPGFLLIAGVFFLAVGQLFEKVITIPFSFYFEEMSELLGYVLILLSALSTFSKSIRLKNRS